MVDLCTWLCKGANWHLSSQRGCCLWIKNRAVRAGDYQALPVSDAEMLSDLQVFEALLPPTGKLEVGLQSI